MKWFMEIINLLLAWLTVESKKGNNPTVDGVADFLGDAGVELGGVKGALLSFGAEFGGATIREVLVFVKNHRKTLFSMTKDEMSHMFYSIFKNKGEFSEEAYNTLVGELDTELLIAEAEANADEMGKIAATVASKKRLLKDMKHGLGVLARFALIKAISIASHGIL